MSDWAGTYSTLGPVNAGMDLEMVSVTTPMVMDPQQLT
jgi:hypothetical protein